MTEHKKEGKSLHRSIYKESILFLLKRYEKLSAQQIQEKIGLKRQTTYNYLNKLKKQNLVQIDYLPHPENPRINVAWYSVKSSKKEIPSDIGNKIYLAEEVITNKEKQFSRSQIKKMLLKKINFTMAALLEQKTIIEQLDDQKIIEYLHETYKTENYPGPFVSLVFLTNEEYKEIGEKFQDFFNQLWNKWREESPGQSDGNIFLYGFFKAPDPL
ncbi:MAG: MarR family transcriptional regulator [Candidatus Heimdallarchaeota archaeon]|nr:MAG: MarR family transcriptional regulator [Candidatus Heimdallarchaeota archaeon]